MRGSRDYYKEFVFTSGNQPIALDLLKGRNLVINIAHNVSSRTYTYDLARSASNCGYVVDVLNTDDRMLNFRYLSETTHTTNFEAARSRLLAYADFVTTRGNKSFQPTLLLLHEPTQILADPACRQAIATLMSKGKSRLVFLVCVGRFEHLDSLMAEDMPAIGVQVNIGREKIKVTMGKDHFSYPSKTCSTSMDNRPSLAA